MTARGRLRLGLALAAVLVALWFAWLARGALLPFIVAAVLAHVLAQPVSRLARLLDRRDSYRSTPRTGAVLIIYAVIAGALVGIGWLFVPWVLASIGDLVAARESIIEGVRGQVDEWLEFYRRSVPETIREQINESVGDLAQNLGDRVGEALSAGVGVLFASVSAALGFLVVPIWLFLILKDQDKLSRWFYGLFPAWLRPDVAAVATHAGKVVGSYLRVLFTLSLIIGSATYIGLLLLGVPYALALAVVAGLAEFVPIIGPIIAVMIAVAVVLAVDPGLLAVWVLLFGTGLQQVENYLLVPRLQGRALDLHPALVILLVIAAGQIAGIMGMIAVIPLFVAVRDSYVYIHRRLGGRLPPPEPAHSVPDPVTQPLD